MYVCVYERPHADRGWESHQHVRKSSGKYSILWMSKWHFLTCPSRICFSLRWAAVIQSIIFSCSYTVTQTYRIHITLYLAYEIILVKTGNLMTTSLAGYKVKTGRQHKGIKATVSKPKCLLVKFRLLMLKTGSSVLRMTCFISFCPAHMDMSKPSSAFELIT